MSANSPSAYNSLPRSSSSLNGTLGRPVPAKGFGSSNYVLKEEFDRDRARWQQKLEEAEAKLVEASIQNTELSQIKAQLNKKIIDIEKNQKPLIEYNKRLAERNRTVMEQCRGLEQSIAFVRDEKLTLKDAYDRLVKDNAALKEQRAFPERLEELERYRNQVLELSKCITALRASIQERDRRHELLIQKFRKIKKALAARKDDDDRLSVIGSEASTGSTLALDTIAEDLDEFQEASLLSVDPSQAVVEQLEEAQAQIAELRAILSPDSAVDLASPEENMTARAAKLQQDHKNLLEKCYLLELELANAKDTNDLLEFQLVEMTSDEESLTVIKTSLRRLQRLFSLKPEQRDTVRNGVAVIAALEHKLSFSQNQLNMTECELRRCQKQANEDTEELRKRLEAATETSSQKKKELKHNVEQLRDERIVLQKELDELKKLMEERERRSNEAEEKIQEMDKFVKDLKKDLAEESQSKNEIIKQLQEARTQVDQAKTLREQLSDKDKKLFTLERNMKNVEDHNTDMEKRFDKELMARNALELRNQQLLKELEEARKEIQRLENEIRPIGTQLERRYEETKYRLAESQKGVEKLEEQLTSANNIISEMKKADGNGERMAREIVQLKRYNDELSTQFNAQMDLISEMKKRFLMVTKQKKGQNESNESISWTSKSSSMDDEQYHSEEGGSEKCHQLHHGSI